MSAETIVRLPELRYIGVLATGKNPQAAADFLALE